MHALSEKTTKVQDVVCLYCAERLLSIASKLLRADMITEAANWQPRERLVRGD